jgi:tetratricopeptide (TPR) repeat protein
MQLPAERPTTADETAELLDGARDAHWEHPATVQAIAVECHEVARTVGDDALRARALAVQGVVSLNRGDLGGAFTLAAEAERFAEREADVLARMEVAALKAQLSFFSGSYTEALASAAATHALADRLGDARNRIYARRAACLVMGNLDAPGWRPELDELIRLSVEVGDTWQGAISRNDLGHWHMGEGQFEESARELARGIALAETLAPDNALLMAVLHCTQAELRLTVGDAAAALRDGQHALELLTAFDEPNPYLFGMTVKLEVQALLALGQADEAKRCGERAVERLGDRVPQARSMILGAVAGALREAVRPLPVWPTD